MAAQPPEKALSSDKKDADYVDASSSPISSVKLQEDPRHRNYTEASSLPVTGEAVEAENDASSSSSSSYLDANTSLHLMHCDSPEPHYIEASSKGNMATDIHNTLHFHDASNSGEQQSNRGGLQDDRHVYFELEKTDDTGKSSEMPNDWQTRGVKCGTIAQAGVNVMARAKAFQSQSHHQEAIYDVPPYAQPWLETEGMWDKQSQMGNSQSQNKDENIYDVTSSCEVNRQTHDAYQSSVEGSGVYEVVGMGVSKPPNYELAKPMGHASHHTTQALSLQSTDSTSSGGFLSCKQGTPRLDHIQHITPSQEEITSEYNRLQFGRNSGGQAQSLPAEAGYSTLEQLGKSQGELYNSTDTFNSRPSWGSDEWSDGSWGSSEFEDDSEEGYLAEPDTPAPTKPLPKIPYNEGSDSLTKAPGLLQKLMVANSRPRAYEDADTVCLPVTLNTVKHPPPELPPIPEGLSDIQKKCRCVVDLTISSERSYIDSLERIVKVYERPILEAIPSSKSHVKVVLRETREILYQHKMFQIELADTVKKWDTEEKIGDIFTASFTKSMLVDAYSSFVNTFAAAMDEIRTVQQSKPSFEEFLKMKEKCSYDRLSIFGLMVKPVQRFPQFIMLLQDLIKYTPPNHHDRRALQLALTELENVTHKLNERKRLSEQFFQAKQTMQLLPRQLPTQILSSRNMEKQRRLIRFDNFDQIDGEMDNMKSSSRRLILMDDMLVCVKVGLKDQDGFMMERYRLKWAVRLCDVELKDNAITPDMRNVVKMDNSRLNALSAQLEKHEEDPFHLYADLRDMLHDLSVFGKISANMKALRRNYQGYNMSGELFDEVVYDLQRMIQIKDEQLRLVNSCSIILVDTTKTDRNHFIMQTPTAAVKNEWCVDFNMAKLAIEKQNQPAWHRSPLTGSVDQEPAPAVFMKCVPVDVPRNFTKVKCAIPIFMPSVPQVSSIGVQHLWVCSSMSSHGQVSIVSVHNTRPALTESFKACECDLLCAELVSGCGQHTDVSRYLFSEDTVWMSNTHNQIVIFPLSSSGGGSTPTRDPLALVRIPGRVTSIKFVDERLFCGLDDGVVLVYSRNDVGEWCIKAARTLELGRVPIKCQLLVEDNLWIACGHRIHVVEIDSLIIPAVHTLSENPKTSILQMVRSGVGMWVAFHDSPTVKLFHLETMENLQELSVANTVNKTLSEKLGRTESRECVVTCITASTGLLWIGTSVGLILTLPLPRLSDGVPQYTGRLAVAYHGHRGPVRFIIPVYCSGNLCELHSNSSLRTFLRARPSMRNLKREKLELKGLGEEKLLSSGTELEASQKALSVPTSKKEIATNHIAKQSDVLDRVKRRPMKSQVGRKLFSPGRGKKDIGSLKAFRKLTHAGNKIQSRTLSFRSQLANRIKHSSLGQFQAQSMFDLRASDACEVELLYENLLDDGDISEDSDSSSPEMFDNLSVQSETAELSNMVSKEPTVFAPKGDAVPQLDLSVLNTEAEATPSSTAVLSGVSGECGAKSGLKLSIPEPVSCFAGGSGDVATPPSSPRIATIRAHTMRKTSTSNAVIVLSGGDGFWDMKSGGNISKNEDASLLFWIYKF